MHIDKNIKIMLKKNQYKQNVFVFSTLKIKYMSCNTLINIRYTKKSIKT